MNHQVVGFAEENFRRQVSAFLAAEAALDDDRLERELC
jgi:hypothetical protein